VKSQVTDDVAQAAEPAVSQVANLHGHKRGGRGVLFHRRRFVIAREPTGSRIWCGAIAFMWQGFCEQLRECGRDGKLFFFIFQVLLLSGVFWDHGGALLLLSVILVSVLWLLLTVVRQRDRFEKLGPFPPLSERELQAARSKLVRARR
jgi:hypothetical protein